MEVWFCDRLWWLCSLCLLGGYGTVSGFCVLRVFGFAVLVADYDLCAVYVSVFGFVCLCICATCWGLIVSGLRVEGGALIRFMLFDFVGCCFSSDFGFLRLGFCGAGCWV